MDGGWIGLESMQRYLPLNFGEVSSEYIVIC